MTTTQQFDNALSADRPVQEKAQTTLALQSVLLSDALGRDDGGNLYRDYFWEYSEETSKLVIDATIQNGDTDWDFICDLLDAYPVEGDHNIHTQIIHGIGAGVINTRMTGALADAPTEGFEYLYQSGIHTIDVPWEDAFCIGWYFDHPDIDVADRLIEFAEEQDPSTFIEGALRTGAVANSDKVVDLFITLDEAGLIDPGPTLFSLDKAYRGDIPRAPRYFDYAERYGISTDFDPDAAAKLVTYIQENWNREFIEHLNSGTALNLLNSL